MPDFELVTLLAISGHEHTNKMMPKSLAIINQIMSFWAWSALKLHDTMLSFNLFPQVDTHEWKLGNKSNLKNNRLIYSASCGFDSPRCHLKIQITDNLLTTAIATLHIYECGTVGWDFLHRLEKRVMTSFLQILDLHSVKLLPGSSQ